MNRILLGLACTNYLLVAIAAYLGLLSDGRGQTDGRDLFHYHLMAAITTALFTMFVHCIIFTYFLGTNRWVRETSAAYSLGDEFSRRSQRCRFRAFSAALIGIFAIVVTVASGAWTDTALPGTEKTWSLWAHRVFPAATYLYMLFAFRTEYLAVEEHMGLTDEVMARVDEIRTARGLPTVAESAAAR